MTAGTFITATSRKIINEPNMTLEEKYAAIIEWLYLHDGNYPDKLKWRSEFLHMLHETLYK